MTKFSSMNLRGFHGLSKKTSVWAFRLHKKEVIGKRANCALWGSPIGLSKIKEDKKLFRASLCKLGEIK